MRKRTPVGLYAIMAYFVIHGLLYIISSFNGWTWSRYLSFIFGNLTIIDYHFMLPFVLGLLYVITAFGLFQKHHWARITLLFLCIQGAVFEFPIGSVLYIAIAIYAFRPSVSAVFPRKTFAQAYHIAGVVVCIVAVAGLLMFTGVSRDVISYTSFKVQGHSPSLDSPESKIIDIDYTIGLIDVLIEFTGHTSMALQQQDSVLADIAPYIVEIKDRFSDTYNAITATVEASYLLKIAENKYVSRIYQVQPSFMFLPSDLELMSFSSGYMFESFAHDQMDIDYLWEKGLDGEGITVAVMDTGIREDHPDLQRDGKSIVVGGLHLYGEFVHEHGTMVASCIASQHETVKGIAPGVNLLNVGVFQWQTVRGTRYLTATNADILKGFEFISNWKKMTGDTVIVTCSWGVSTDIFSHDADLATQAANRLAVEHNIPIIASAGNRGPSVRPYVSIPHQIMSPAGGRNVLSVGAVDSTNTIATFSSIGPYYDGTSKPDVVAPGVDIPVITPLGFDIVSGTSFAGPYVSGLAALLLQENPDISSQQLYDAIKRGATDLGPEGYDYQYGYGLANAEGSYMFIEHTKSQVFVLALFIGTIGLGMIIVSYPYINKGREHTKNKKGGEIL